MKFLTHAIISFTTCSSVGTGERLRKTSLCMSASQPANSSIPVTIPCCTRNKPTCEPDWLPFLPILHPPSQLSHTRISGICESHPEGRTVQKLTYTFYEHASSPQTNHSTIYTRHGLLPIRVAGTLTRHARTTTRHVTSP